MPQSDAMYHQQECIPVGCVPSAAVAAWGGGGLPKGWVSARGVGVSAWGFWGCLPGGVCLGGAYPGGCLPRGGCTPPPPCGQNS